MKKLALVLAAVVLISAFSGCSSVPDEAMNEVADQMQSEFENSLQDVGDAIEEKAKEEQNREKEIKTITKIITVEADTLKEWQEKIAVEERSVIPILGNNIIINANGKEEYRGYIIIGRSVLEYQDVSVEVPTQQGPGNVPTKTIYLKAPSKIEYTLHKHEVTNKLTETSIGAFLVGLVNMQLVCTQSCDCGYASVTSWEIPDITSIAENKYTGEDLYIQTEQPWPPK